MLGNIAIDLGTDSILGATERQGIVFNEPTVVAINKNTGKVVGVGKAVSDYLGREHDDIQLIMPLRNGVISDFDKTTLLLSHVLKAVGHNFFFKPKVTIGVPSKITSIEGKSLIEAAKSVGARDVHLLYKPVAAALGIGVDIAPPRGNLIVDVGSGTTDSAVISMNDIVTSGSSKSAGDSMDFAIARYVKATFGIIIGKLTAERIKKEIGNVYDDSWDKQTIVKGQCMVTGLPKSAEITSKEIYPVLLDEAKEIATSIGKTLDDLSPELTGDIAKNGLYLTGGGGELTGLNLFLQDFINTKVHLSVSPTTDTIVGILKSFNLTADYLTCFFDPYNLNL